MWHPGVPGIAGEAANKPPSILYSTVNPATAGTVGSTNADAQVVAGAANTGALGKIITDTMLLDPQAPVPVVPAGVAPQTAAVT